MKSTFGTISDVVNDYDKRKGPFIHSPFPSPYSILEGPWMQGHEEKNKYFQELISRSRRDIALGDADRTRSNWADLAELALIIERWCQSVGIDDPTGTYRSNPTDRNRNRQLRRFLYKNLEFASEFARVDESNNGSFTLRRPVRTNYDTKVTLVVKVTTIFQYRITGYIHVWDDGRPYFLDFEVLNGSSIARMLGCQPGQIFSGISMRTRSIRPPTTT